MGTAALVLHPDINAPAAALTLNSRNSRRLSIFFSFHRL
jgi:hypothetical protein